jgi:ATP-binding cassette subfamily C protein
MALGKIISTDAAPSILLNGCDTVWLVEHGGVDIFAVPILAAIPSGARQHICRLSSGQLLMGLGNSSLDSAMGLLAVCLPQTQLQQLDGPAVEAVFSNQPAELVVAWVDAWLVALTSSISSPPPRVYVDAISGISLLIKSDETLFARDTVTWLDFSASAIIWQPAGHVIQPQIIFPLTRSTWASATTELEVTCISTIDMVQSNRIATGLLAFHHKFLDYLFQQREYTEQTIQKRLLHKQHSEQQLFGDALVQMSQVLAANGTPELALARNSTDPLANACQLVMDAGGIRANLKTDIHALEITKKIENLAYQAHACYRTVTLSGESWWREDFGPLLAFRSADTSPVVLLPASSQGYWLVDVENGIRQRLDRDSAASLAVVAFMFFRTFPDKAVGMLDLLRFGMAGTGRDVMRLLTVGAMGGLLGLFTPFATGLLIDSVIPNAQSSELLQLSLLLLTAAIGVSAFELTRAIAMMRIDTRIGNATQAAIIHRLLHLPVPFFRNYSAGDLAQRAFGIASILQLLSNTTQAALLSWIFGLFSYAYLFFINVQLALIATLLVVVALTLTTVLNLWRLKMERQMFQVQGDIASRVFQILNGIAKLRASGAEKRAFSLWAKDFSRQKTLDFNTRRISNMLSAFDAGYVVLASLLLFATVAYFVPDINTGSFIAFNAAFAQFFAATLAMITALTASLNVIPLYERAKPILQGLPEVAASQNTPGELSGSIDINHITFRYTADGPAILNDISISINPGEFIAFVGPSGSGKSTLFRLLLGFEHAESGAIYYDGQDLSGLDVAAVRRQLGVVLQNGKLMPGDIFTNIVGSSPLTLDDAWQAARMAGLEEDINSMPMGMHTVIAEGAGTISGGQKQRLMVARAIVKKPRILLFDEATSALDNNTQATVARSIESLNATRIVIAHRLSTIIKADRIFVIEAGQVVETGNYAQLMSQNGSFAELAKRQIA